MSKVQELVERTAREIRQNYDLPSIESALYRVIEQTQGVTVNPSKFTAEAVRSLCMRWYAADIGDEYIVIQEWLEQNQVEQNQVEPIVVGLSDEQVNCFYEFTNRTANKNQYIGDLYKKWAKTQLFVQPDAGITDIKPNWGDSSAKYFQIRECWVDERGTVTSWKLNKQFERPQPTPQVEVGQVWGCAKTEVIVIALNEGDVVFQKVITKGFDMYSIIDFLAKFERVGGTE